MPRISLKKAKQNMKRHAARLKKNPDLADAEKYADKIPVHTFHEQSMIREAIRKAYLAGLRKGKKSKTKTITKTVYHSYDRDSLA